MGTPVLPTIYCQMGFLERFLTMCHNSLDDLLLNQNAQAESLTACFRLLYGAVNLHLDVTSTTLTSHPNPLVKKLWKKSTGSIKCEPTLNNQLQEDAFWQHTTTEIFMLALPEAEANAMEKDWGIMVLTPDKLAQKGRRLLADAPIFVGKDDKTFKWEALATQAHCFHSAVLVDNYLEPDANKLKMNILPLIKSQLSVAPRKRQVHLTIITTNDYIELVHKNLSSLLDSNNIHCSLRVIKTQTLKNHDRHFITNQRWIFSGFGFNLLKWNNEKHCSVIQQSTTILCMPIVSNGYVAYKTDEYNDNPASTYYGTVWDILGRLRKIDSETPEKIGTQVWAVGETNPYY